jgi:large subunit ribosomal protein L4
MAVATYTKSGTKAATAATLDKKVFGLEVKNHELLKQAYLAYLANGRVNSAKTKKRGEVSGGGIKPWRQKGTGRARFGSSRNPLWTGGGVAFGPTGNENYSRKLNVAAKRTAIRQALSLANKEDRIRVIETFTPAEAKTKAAFTLLAKINASGRTLLIIEDKSNDGGRATKNLKDVKTIQANYINVFDVMNAQSIVITKKALEAVTQWLGGSAVKPSPKPQEAKSE